MPMNLKLSWKLALIGISSSVPLLCGTFYLINKYTNKDIRIAVLEQYGNRFLQPLDDLIEHLPEHQALEQQRRQGDPAVAAALAASEAQVNRAFAELQARTSELGPALQYAGQDAAQQLRAGVQLAKLQQAWLELKHPSEHFSAEDIAARHVQLRAEVRSLIAYIGNTSNLILDPELASYYLVDAVLVALPQTQDRLASLLTAGSGLHKQPGLPAPERIRLAGQALQLGESDLDRIARDVRTVLAAETNPPGGPADLARSLLPAYQPYADATAAFVVLLKRVAESGSPAVSATEFTEAGERARRHSFALWATAQRELDRLLQRRIDGLNQARNAGLGLVALSLGLAVGVTVMVARNINRIEQQIRELNATLELRVARRTIELEAANKELESFSYSVSHDLRTPLRGIAGFTEALSRNHRSRLDAEGGKYLDRVLAAAERMGHLIDDLLNLSRVGRADLVRRPVDLSAMVRSIADNLQHTAPQRPVEWVIGAGITGEGDSRLLRIVLENLLGNAWKFTAKQPAARIEFGAAPGPDGRTACYVRDNGAGFDMNHAAKLFDPFQRMHSLNEFPGTGIGLATVKRIILRHGGQVWAEARIDAGATIHFTLESLPA